MAPSRRSPRPQAAPVEVRSMSSPKPGWTLVAAVALLHDGYTPEQVERMTGFAAAHVVAQQRDGQQRDGHRPRGTGGAT